MKTKFLHAFISKLAYFDDDIELLDVLKTSVTNNELTDAKSPRVLKNVDPVRHKHLSRRSNSDGSRKLIINHLRKTLYTAYVKDVYEEVTSYLRSILESAAKNKFDAGRIIGEHQIKFDAARILSAGNWDNVAQLITDSVFQSLESEKSTLKLIEKTSKKLNLGVATTTIDASIPYLEIRHFLVHSDGKLTTDFIAKYPTIRHYSDYVSLDFNFITKFKEVVLALVQEFDQKVVLAGILKPSDVHP